MGSSDCLIDDGGRSLGVSIVAPRVGRLKDAFGAAASQRSVAACRPLPLLDPADPRRRGTGAFARGAGHTRRETMLRIYTTILEVLRELRPVLAQIETSDRDLARQLRRDVDEHRVELLRGQRVQRRDEAGALSECARVSAGDGRMSRCGDGARVRRRG